MSKTVCPTLRITPESVASCFTASPVKCGGIQRLTLKVRPGAQHSCLSHAQLVELASRLHIEFPEGTLLVQISPFPPADTTLPWQQSDNSGTPVGGLKTFSDGRWQ